MRSRDISANRKSINTDSWEFADPVPAKRRSRSRKQNKSPSKRVSTSGSFEIPAPVPAKRRSRSRNQNKSPSKRASKRVSKSGSFEIPALVPVPVAAKSRSRSREQHKSPEGRGLEFAAPTAKYSDNPLYKKVKDLEYLGKGGYSKVYKGVNDVGEEKAYKLFGSEDMTDVVRTTNVNFVREAAIYKYLGNRNPGLCNVSEIGQGYISMCLADGDLHDEISTQGQANVYPLKSIIGDMAMLLATVDSLHGENVGHFDIKPENILRGNDGKLKICDLGSAHIFTRRAMQKFENLRREFIRGGTVDIHKLSHMNTPITKKYAAPEIFVSITNGLPMYPAADIWSLGILFFQLLTGYNFSKIIIRRDKAGDIAIYTGNPIMNPSSFADRFTKDMNREGFRLYDKDWNKTFDSQSKFGKPSNVSPYELILQEQINLSFALDDKDKEQIKYAWGIINAMLDPNPLTRITARECLDSPLFKPYAQDIKEFYLEHKRRTEENYKGDVRLALGTDGHKLSKLFKDIYDMRNLKTYGDVQEHNNKPFELIVYRVDNKIGKQLQSGPELNPMQKQLIYFCMMVLSFYSEYRLINSKRRLSDLSIILENDQSLGEIHRNFISDYEGDLHSLRNMIYNTTYFLLVNVLNFDFSTDLQAQRIFNRRKFYKDRLG